MKKLALAIGFAAYFVFGASSALAAFRVDYGAGVATNRESRNWSETGTNPRLLFLNEALYPETTVAVDAILAYRQGERGGAAQSRTATDTRLLFVNEALYPEMTATVDAILAHRQGERGGTAQSETSRTDTLRMICGDDLCLEP